MEISDVRKRLHEAMARARQRSADRRARADAAGRAFDKFLAAVAVPLFRQIANVLRADGYPYSVSTPAGSVRLMSDKGAEDFIELSLDTASDAPRVLARVSRSHGRRVVDAERVIATGDPESVSEEQLLEFLLKELEPFVER
jgi:hypothetical protein